MPRDVARWTDISADPNTSEVRVWRQQRLDAARQAPIADRNRYLCELVAGKDVLDVGVVDHEVGSHGSHEWLHDLIAKAARQCLGVDILESAVQELKQRGYNVICHDITAKPLDRQFDLIICGEVIEHLGRPADLFDATRPMLRPGGRLVLSTPNPFFHSRFRDNVRNRFHENVDHVFYLFPSGIAELAERAGMELVSYRGIFGRRYTRFPGTARVSLARTFHGISGAEQFCRNMLYECQPQER